MPLVLSRCPTQSWNLGTPIWKTSFIIKKKKKDYNIEGGLELH